MILERVLLESWGCLKWPVEIHFHPRVNLIHAPNESGKTTLVNAIRMLLLEPVSANVAVYRPWGSEVAPRGVVEFRTKKGRWRVEKTFTRNGHARLLKERNGIWEPVSTDPDRVHVRTVELVTGATVVKRRGRERAHDQMARHGVLYALWLDQGRLPLEQLQLVGAAERDLAAAVGAVVIAERDRLLVEAARKRAAYYLTEKRKAETGELAAAAERVRTARENLERQRERAAELNEWQEKVENATFLMEETELLLRDAKQQLAQVEEQLGKLVVVDEELTGAKKRRHETEMALTTWRKKLDDLEQTRRTLLHYEQERVALAEKSATRQRLSDQYRRQYEENERQLDALEEPARHSAAAVRLARDRLDLARAFVELRDLQTRLETAKPLLEERQSLMKERQGLIVPSEVEWKQLLELQTSLAIEEAKVAAARMRVTWHADTDLDARITVDDRETDTVRLPAQSSTEWEALEKTEIRWDGLGTIRIERALETTVTRQLEKVKALRNSLTDELRTWGVSSLEAIERRIAQASACDLRLTQVEATLQGLLPEGRSTVEERLARVEARIYAIRARAPELRNEDPDIDTAEKEVREAEEVARQQALLVEEQRERGKMLQEQLQKADIELERIEARLRQVEGEIHTLNGRLQVLEDDGLTDSERVERLVQLEAAFIEAEQEVQRLTARANTYEEVQGEYEACKRSLQSLLENRDRYRHELTAASVRAAALAEDGAYSALVRAEEEMQLAISEYDNLRMKAEARDLLVRTLLDECERHRSELFEPIERRVSNLWERVSGGRYVAVKVVDQLRPNAVVPRDYPEETPPPERLSGGAQEQLGTIVRLALAETLASASEDEGQTVILDEPLPHSDPLRRRRVVELLSHPAPGVQIIILAHDPRDYAALRTDAEHDLTVLIYQAQEAAAARES